MLEKTGKLEGTEAFLLDYRYNFICEYEEIRAASAEKKNPVRILCWHKSSAGRQRESSVLR